LVGAIRQRLHHPILNLVQLTPASPPLRPGVL
jgi:hypothetical protein